MKFIQILLLHILIIVFSGCMKQQSEALLNSSQDATDGLGCQNMRSKTFDSLYSYIDQENKNINLPEFTSLIKNNIDQIAQKQNIKDIARVSSLKYEYTKLFHLLAEKNLEKKTIVEPKEYIQRLIELEMEDQSSEENIQLNKEVAEQFKAVNALVSDLNIECNEPTDPTDPTDTVDNTPVDNPNYYSSKMVVGMNNAISTAYQSCETLTLPAMTASTPNVSGVTVLAQMHPDGIGSKRVIGNLSQVQQTHPYIRVSGNTTSSSCFNVMNNPLIYDYGGEPSISNNVISFFKNAGSGTTVLGVDCSALVSTAAAAGGLRYKPGLENKAVYVRQNSSKFISATSSNFTCYQNITLTKTTSIKPGDIAAVVGHVLMVDKVGEDPFAFKKLTSVSQCSSISYRNFDFTVAQSSPSKNGVGINRYLAKDYLAESEKMRTLFVSMAQSACKAYFNNTSIKPSSSAWGIIRHKGTSDCMAPKIQMVGQSCVSQCQRQ